MDSTNLVNASIVSYVSFTFLFFVLKFRFFPQTGYMWIVPFLTLSCIMQFIQNLNLSSSPQLCGKPDFKMALYATLVPWLLIFTVFTLFLMVAPGWLRVFSNTFGVSAAEAYGIKNDVVELFQRPGTPINDPMFQILERIYSDTMALVIELNIEDVTEIKTPTDFPAINKLVEMKIINPIPPEKVDVLKRIHSALLIKDNVGFFFWFLLIGIFCILVSTITLLTSSCTPKIGSSYDSIFNS